MSGRTSRSCGRGSPHFMHAVHAISSSTHESRPLQGLCACSGAANGDSELLSKGESEPQYLRGRPRVPRSRTRRTAGASQLRRHRRQRIIGPANSDLALSALPGMDENLDPAKDGSLGNFTSVCAVGGRHRHRCDHLRSTSNRSQAHGALCSLPSAGGLARPVCATASRESASASSVDRDELFMLARRHETYDATRRSNTP
jgi:hypothetical protein